MGPPRECYNTITPNDMKTDARCAVMGAILFFGAWVVILSCEEPLSQALLGKHLTSFRLFQTSGITSFSLLEYQTWREI